MSRIVIGVLPDDWTNEQFNELLERSYRDYASIVEGPHRMALEGTENGLEFVIEATKTVEKPV